MHLTRPHTVALFLPPKLTLTKANAKKRQEEELKALESQMTTEWRSAVEERLVKERNKGETDASLVSG